MKLMLEDNVTIPIYMSILYMYNKDVTTVKEIRKRVNINNDLYIYEVNKSLIKLGLIELEKIGRTNKITLTDKGKKVGVCINLMFETLGITEESFVDKNEEEVIEEKVIEEKVQDEKNATIIPNTNIGV